MIMFSAFIKTCHKSLQLTSLVWELQPFHLLQLPAQSIKIDTLKLNLIGDYREIKVAKH